MMPNRYPSEERIHVYTEQFTQIGSAESWVFFFINCARLNSCWQIHSNLYGDQPSWYLKSDVSLGLNLGNAGHMIIQEELEIWHTYFDEPTDFLHERSMLRYNPLVLINLIIPAFVVVGNDLDSWNALTLYAMVAFIGFLTSALLFSVFLVLWMCLSMTQKLSPVDEIEEDLKIYNG
ncbi:hypothetical protein CEXT_587481 [Caerostris extrusa]|uniref:Uncharacterized protein n=1 Tax=Caerostris extrusa TaxID=172846 RepID=A0AAV4VUM4_CAEEX|nr:hypothetical protein CEXT_587481 [Caerostris extrusa]